MATEAPAIYFSRLTLSGWRQFESIDIELHPSLTVLTGANGSGKSTLLNVFSQHFGYQRPYLATPRRDQASGSYKYFAGIFEWLKDAMKPSQANAFRAGEITYSNGVRAGAEIPNQGGVAYNLTLVGPQSVAGFHVPSHRQMPVYRQVTNIPTQAMLPQQAYDGFNAEMSTLFTGGHTGLSPTYRIKEALLSMAVFGPGSKYVERNEVVISAFEGYINILKEILPAELGFEDISIRTPDVVLVTKSGEFLIDAASGGVMSLVDLAWQIHMFSLRSGGRSFVVTIDEPENHLHPAMQRTLMANLVKTFPKVQFIVATHSPFIVSSLRDASVYVLRYQDKAAPGEAGEVASSATAQSRFVSSLRLDSVNLAGTASHILRDVLGLPTTFPAWAQETLDQVVQKYRGRPFDATLLREVREELEGGGFGELYPDAISSLTKP